MTDYDVGMGGGAILRLSVVTASQDIVNNTSTLSWSLTLYKGSFSSFDLSGTAWSVGIGAPAGGGGGGSYGGSQTFDFRSTTSQLMGAGSTVVTHAADGTASLSVSGNIGATGTSTGGPASNGGPYTPATIPRASTPTFELVSAPGVLITSCDAGLAIKLNMNRASSTFTHTVEYQIGATGWQTIATAVGASYASWSIPLSLLNQIPNAASGTLQIRVTTYTNSGATLVGSTTTSLTMTAGAAIIPDLGTITNSEATVAPDVATLIGAYVQGLTTLNVAITSPAGIYGSTIVAQKIEVVGQAGNQITNAVATALSGVLPAALAASGTVTLRATVTDSRNRTYSEDVTITVLAYTIPVLNAPVTVRRALSGGTVDNNGTYIRTDINAAVQSLTVSAVQKNAITYRISTSPHGTNTWTVKTTTSPGGLTFNSHAEVGTYLISSSFDVKVEVYDKLAALALVLVIATSAVPLHLGATGIGINQFNTGVADLEVAGSIQSNGRLVDTAATTTASGIIEIATGAEALALTDNVRAISPLALASVIAAILAQLRVRNKVRNGNFQHNSRRYVSGAVMAPFGHDGWQTSLNVTPQTNLLSNPDAEVNTTGTTGTGATLTRDTTTPIAGAASFKLVATADDSYMNVGGDIGALRNSMAAGHVYTAYGTARVGTVFASEPQALAQWPRSIVGHYLSAGIYYPHKSIAAPNVVGTTRLKNTMAIPAGATEAFWRFYCGLNGATIWWDDLTVIEETCNYTFTQAPQGCTITIGSGFVIHQTIPREDVEAGTFVLSWTGTATGRAYNAGTAGGGYGVTPPAYGTSGSTFTLDGLSDVIVEFAASGGSKTLGKVQLELGTVVSPFEVVPYQQVVAQCERFYKRYQQAAGAGAQRFFSGWQLDGTQWISEVIKLPVPMRVPPSAPQTIPMLDCSKNTLYLSDGASATGAFPLGNIRPHMVTSSPDAMTLYLSSGASLAGSWRLAYVETNTNTADRWFAWTTEPI